MLPAKTAQRGGLGEARRSRVRNGLRRLTLTVLLLTPISVGLAEELLPAGLDDGGSAVVIEVIDGDTVVLDDGRQVRLVGIQAPKLALGRAGFTAWPLSEEAKATLESLALGRVVALGYGGRRLDRHGRQLAHLATEPEVKGGGALAARPGGAARDAGGFWLQGEMLRRGFARTYSFADNRALVTEMLQLEDHARRAGRGIWSDPFYTVRRAGPWREDVGSFQLVLGSVLEAATVRGRVYLNFGDDWKTDFTVTLDTRSRRLFEADGIDPESYRGQTVRVRGWIKSFNGPMIEATHPEQIEILR